jgi:hypothetical protein
MSSRSTRLVNLIRPAKIGEEEDVAVFIELVEGENLTEDELRDHTPLRDAEMHAADLHPLRSGAAGDADQQGREIQAQTSDPGRTQFIRPISSVT